MLFILILVLVLFLTLTTSTPTSSTTNVKPKTAIVVLVSTDEYAISSCVLSKTWRATKSVESNTDFIAIVPINTLSQETLTWMKFPNLCGYQIIHPPVEQHKSDIGGREDLAKLGAPKMYTWNLIQYDRILYLDADSYALEKVNYLFDNRYWKGNFTAVKEFDTKEGGFKGGQLAIKPNPQTYDELIDLLGKSGKLENADQTFLNNYFHKEWHAKPDLERLPQENLLCSAYCVLAELRPQYRDSFTRMINSAAMFDCQGKNKYWNMPPSQNIAVQRCQQILPFVNFWLALAYAPDIPTVTQLLRLFTRTEFDYKLMEIALQAALNTFMEGSVPFQYYNSLQRITEHMMSFPTFRNVQVYGSKATTTKTHKKLVSGQDSSINNNNNKVKIGEWYLNAEDEGYFGSTTTTTTHNDNNQEYL
jgi:hypothetical protein